MLPAWLLVDPALLSAGDWQRLAGMLNDLYVATGLGIAAAMSFLLAHAILPSLVATRDIAASFRGARPVFYFIAACAFGITSYALARAFIEGVAIVEVFYPRFGY